jgi:hypothetical protein
MNNGSYWDNSRKEVQAKMQKVAGVVLLHSFSYSDSAPEGTEEQDCDN